jgi:hypothetical protein
MSEPVATAEIVRFHVRGMRYGTPFRTDDPDEEDEEFDSLERTMIWIGVQVDPPGAGAVGWSCCHEIWSGDEMLYDQDATMKMVEERQRHDWQCR